MKRILTILLLLVFFQIFNQCDKYNHYPYVKNSIISYVEKKTKYPYVLKHLLNGVSTNLELYDRNGAREIINTNQITVKENTDIIENIIFGVSAYSISNLHINGFKGILVDERILGGGGIYIYKNKKCIFSDSVRELEQMSNIIIGKDIELMGYSFVTHGSGYFHEWICYLYLDSKFNTEALKIVKNGFYSYGFHNYNRPINKAFEGSEYRMTIKMKNIDINKDGFLDLALKEKMNLFESHTNNKLIQNVYTSNYYYMWNNKKKKFIKIEKNK